MSFDFQFLALYENKHAIQPLFARRHHFHTNCKCWGPYRNYVGHGICTLILLILVSRLNIIQILKYPRNGNNLALQLGFSFQVSWLCFFIVQSIQDSTSSYWTEQAQSRFKLSGQLLFGQRSADRLLPYKEIWKGCTGRRWYIQRFT
jgi:hypothetical protein